MIYMWTPERAVFFTSHKEGENMAQIHKRFTDEQVRGLFERYVRKEVARKYLQEMLGISKSRFFHC